MSANTEFNLQSIELVQEQVQELNPSVFRIESIHCHLINCYLCQNRGIVNPLVVSNQYRLTQDNILSNQKLKPICYLHNATLPSKTKSNPEQSPYLCHQMTPDEKYAESHTTLEIERKTQIMKKLQQLNDEFQEQQQQEQQQQEQQNKKFQPQYHHLMSQYELHQQALIQEQQQEQQKIADNAVISKWMSHPPQPKHNTSTTMQFTCCEPIREPVIDFKFFDGINP